MPDGLKEFLQGLPKRLDWGVPTAKPTAHDRQWSRLTSYLERGDWPRATASLLARVWIISFAQAYLQHSGLSLTKIKKSAPSSAKRTQSGTSLELHMGKDLHRRANLSIRAESASQRDHWVRLRLAKELGMPVQPVAIFESSALEGDELSVRIGKVEVRCGRFDARGLVTFGPADVRLMLESAPPGAPSRDLLRFWRCFFRPVIPSIRRLFKGDPLANFSSPIVDLAEKYLTGDKSVSGSRGKLSLSFVLSSVALSVALGSPEHLCSPVAVKLLVSQLKRQDPGLFRELQSSGTRELLARVLRRLLEERVSVRRLATIVSFVVEHGPLDLDPAPVCEEIRAAIGATITSRYENPRGSLSYLAVDPDLLDNALDDDPRWLEELSSFEGGRLLYGKPTVFIVAPAHRREFFERTQAHLTDHAVLSWDEIDPRLVLTREGTVGTRGLRLEP
jgi:flagellar biosynthesis component FlhA